MTSTSALVDTAALLLFQNIREGIETGRITSVNTALTEVDAAIAELNRRRPCEEPTHVNELVGKLLVEVGSLHEKVAKCEKQLSEFQSQAEDLKEETAQIVARTETCNLLVQQQQIENVKVLAAMEGAKTTSISTVPPPCIAPAPSPIDPILRPAPSRMAVVSFPGGPRTITIHPPDSPHYQSIIRDENGDVIVTLKATKPLRREGAFRGPIEDIDWLKITRVYGRGHETGPRSAPPVPRWPEQPHLSSCPLPLRGPSEIIARQRQLSTSMQTDAFGRVIAPEYITCAAKSPSLLTGNSSSSSEPSQDSQSSSVKLEVVTTPSLTPPSPSVGRGKKRTRHVEEDEGVPLATETDDGAHPTNAQSVLEPTTPTPVKREESYLSEGPAKRKKLRSSASLEALSAESLSRTRSLLDAMHSA